MGITVGCSGFDRHGLGVHGATTVSKPRHVRAFNSFCSPVSPPRPYSWANANPNDDRPRRSRSAGDCGSCRGDRSEHARERPCVRDRAGAADDAGRGERRHGVQLRRAASRRRICSDERRARQAGAGVAFGRAASVGMVGLYRGNTRLQAPAAGVAYPWARPCCPPRSSATPWGVTCPNISRRTPSSWVRPAPRSRSSGSRRRLGRPGRSVGWCRVVPRRGRDARRQDRWHGVPACRPDAADRVGITAFAVPSSGTRRRGPR